MRKILFSDVRPVFMLKTWALNAEIKTTTYIDSIIIATPVLSLLFYEFYNFPGKICEKIQMRNNDVSCWTWSKVATANAYKLINTIIRTINGLQ